MVMVCEGVYKKRPQGFGMDKYLKESIDLYVKNVVNDWDFTIIITGSGMVRVGKSVLGQQIGAYWTDQMKKVHGITVPFTINNLVFDGSVLIQTGNDLGTKHKYSCMIFDEAGADLEGIKAMRATTQAVKDYFRECGQYNMLNILILPEFFDLPKGIALSRSNCLVDVSYFADKDGMMRRGHFKFFSRPNKKFLYIKGKKTLNYTAQKHDFRGTFSGFEPLDSDEYREKKKEALKNREYLNAQQMRMKQGIIGLTRALRDIGKTYVDIADHASYYSRMEFNAKYFERIDKEGKESLAVPN